MDEMRARVVEAMARAMYEHRRIGTWDDLIASDPTGEELWLERARIALRALAACPEAWTIMAAARLKNLRFDNSEQDDMRIALSALSGDSQNG